MRRAWNRAARRSTALPAVESIGEFKRNNLGAVIGLPIHLPKQLFGPISDF